MCACVSIGSRVLARLHVQVCVCFVFMLPLVSLKCFRRQHMGLFVLFALLPWALLWFPSRVVTRKNVPSFLSLDIEAIFKPQSQQVVTRGALTAKPLIVKLALVWGDFSSSVGLLSMKSSGSKHILSLEIDILKWSVVSYLACLVSVYEDLQYVSVMTEICLFTHSQTVQFLSISTS